MENISEKLKSLGIDGKEADIYLALLRLKKATIIQLAKNTSIKRTTVYHIIDDLIAKGLVFRYGKDGSKNYVAENPEVALKKMVENSQETVRDVLPDLKKIFGSALIHPEIRIFENENGIKKVLEDVLASQEKTCRYYVSDFNLEEFVGKSFVDQFVKKRIEAGIHSLSLRSFKYKPEREQETTHAKQHREVRFMPEGMEMKPYMCIYDNKVAVISSKEEKLGFIIHSKEFADAQKTIFDMLWNNLAI